MNPFSHFLLTMFNVERHGKPVKGRSPIDEEYLEKRFKLFNEFCYSSVSSQTNKNFKWAVLFSSKTPEKFKKRINEYKKLKNFIPVFINKYDSLHEKIKELILTQQNEKAKFLITTNIDNDDAVSKYFIESIQNNFQPKTYYLNFIFGYRYEIKTNNLFLREYLVNPFRSLIEKSNEFKTVWHTQHSAIYQIDHEVVQRSASPLWLQIVHDTNLTSQSDVNSIWQPLGRLKPNFLVRYHFSKILRFSIRDSFFFILKALRSKKHKLRWKIKSIIVIFFPQIIYFLVKIKLMYSTGLFKKNTRPTGDNSR